MEYFALKEDTREVLYFQEYYTLEIHNLHIYPYYGTNMKIIAHMVDEVCKEVDTRVSSWSQKRRKKGRFIKAIFLSKQ